jgi:hypothetical protein
MTNGRPPRWTIPGHETPSTDFLFRDSLARDLIVLKFFCLYRQNFSPIRGIFISNFIPTQFLNTPFNVQRQMDRSTTNNFENNENE